jgi:hypothetical protein
MTAEEVAIYEAHLHDVARYGTHAGKCCMESLDAIIEARKEPTRTPTLFDLEAYA